MTAALVILAVLAVAGGVSSAYLVTLNRKIKDATPKLSEEEAVKISSERAKGILEKAERESDRLVVEAKDKLRKSREEAEKLDVEMVQRETNLVKRERVLQQKYADAEKIRDEADRIKQNIESVKKELETKLEQISGLSKEQAKEKLMTEIEEDLKGFHAQRIRQEEKKIAEASDEKAKEILVEAMQKIATEYVGEATVATVKVDDENIKGRIIGREGRNIRAFEKATGVDVIIDESPNAIALSSFDPLRREIAAISMKLLMADGRIHPGRIEEVVKKAKDQVTKEIKESGQQLADEAGWPGIDMGLITLLGKMKYRTSYGQSLMKHTIEVIRIGVALAQELNADVELVKKACLLHDVGKVLTHKVEGSHHHLSGEVARKYHLPDKLVNAIEAHHLDIEAESVEAVIVYLADAISGARPGARKDSYESYIKRVKGIEEAAMKVGGKKISEVYAIHAGREVRVIVKPEMIDDDEAVVLSKKIADDIEKSQTYPGTVQVTVIRESRAVSVAK